MDAEKPLKIETNKPKAYIHFARATQVAFFHNSREAFLPQTSVEELRGKNICDRTAAEARALFQKLDEQADAAFLAKAGRRTNMKESNKIWEYVCLLKEENTWEDVERLMKRVEKETGYTTLQASIHEDEGHFDEHGVFKKNRHIQVDVFTRSLEDGRSLCLENYGKKDLMKRLQKIVSEELGLEAGEPKEITKRKHIPHRKYRAMKEAENNKEWEQKLEKNNQEWEQKKAEWEQKQAEREARQAEWEAKIPEIVAARERRSKYISENLDWEDARMGKMLAREMQILGMNFAGIANPQGNILVEAQKSAIRNIFYMLGVSAQLAVVLLKKTLQNDEKLAADAKIYNVESTLLRAVDHVANSDPGNAEELKKRIQRTFRTIPEDKRRELFEYAIENAPTPELKADIKALIEGRFSDIAKSEVAQKRIENRDLKAALREYAEEARKIRDELREMDEENRILNAAERALLREKGAGREEYGEQEAQNRKRIEDIKKLKDEAKALNNTIRDQKQTPDKDAQTIREQAEKIKELNEKIAEITKENTEKQKELDAAKIITPKMLEAAFEKIDDLEEKLKQPEKQHEEPKPEPEKIEPKIEPKPAKDDFTNIFGYERPNIEPRRRLDDIKPRPREPDRPRYVEPKPIREPEKPKDPWDEIEEDLQVWKTKEVAGEKALIAARILRKLDNCEKNGEMNDEKREYVRRVKYALNMLDPFKIAEQEAEARRNEETIKKVAAIHRELESKHKQAEIQIETAIKYEDVKQKTSARKPTQDNEPSKRKKTSWKWE